ncbi:MAG: PIN domain-containing protein [Gammaproteobacteria bacterium]|nr:PIN domain-containing protein [Gammaproteobacteria bacterium]
MSAERCFIDTNVLVYLFDADSPGKQARSRELLEEVADSAVLSTQVLAEFYVAVTRKLGKPLPAIKARDAVESLCELEVRPVHTTLVKSAIRRSRDSQLSYWDALIIETAMESDASTLFTEDLQHGQKFDHLRVVDPFR